MVNKPPLPEKTVEGHDFERFPELMAETESNPAPSSDPNDNVTCLYSANLTSRYFPPRQSSSSEESRLRSTFDEVEPDDDELTLPRKAGANGYYSSTRVSWPFDQASSASTSYNEGPPYPYPVHVQVTSDYASSPHILGAQFSERDLEQVYLASSSSGAAGSVPRALSNERHSHRDAGVSTDPEAPRGSWSRDNGYGTRSHFSDTHRTSLSTNRVT